MKILADIYLGDSKEQLKLLPEKCIDLIVTSELNFKEITIKLFCLYENGLTKYERFKVLC